MFPFYLNLFIWLIGFNGLVMGYTGDEDAPTYFPARLKAVRKVRLAGFKEIAEKEAEAAYKKQQTATPHNDNNAKK